MKRLIGALLVTGVVGLVANPAPADAQGNELEWATVKCMNHAVQSCDDDFPATDWRMAGLRGWCYSIRTAICMVSPEEVKDFSGLN